MAENKKYKIFITIGCLMWTVSFLGEAFVFQPYSTVGMIISPILTITGLFYWFKNYKSKKGHYPNFWAVYKENFGKIKQDPFVGINFMFNHVLETWTLAFIFWMGLTLIMFLTFEQSASFQITKDYCESNRDIVNKTGLIKYYGTLVGGRIETRKDGGKAQLSFTIIAEKGKFSAYSELTNQNSKWTVDTVVIHQ